MHTKLIKSAELNTLDHTARLEIQIVYKHLSQSGSLDTYLAERLYGIRELRTVINKLQRIIPIKDDWVTKPHPRTSRPTKVKKYWLESHVIESLGSNELMEELANQQLAAKIAKQRAKNIKALESMCNYSTRETVIKHVDRIYQQQIANDE
ncbi:hypothetical protein V6248_03705 [Pseudoalteromonas agarivorans]|uniref:hypothetical protein n=1 Tax=Pseudoalteromonas agarivorans TaxID=176102 RepID=UPI00311E08E6